VASVGYAMIGMPGRPRLLMKTAETHQINKDAAALLRGWQLAYEDVDP
jgi:hypothetical protein